MQNDALKAYNEFKSDVEKSIEYIEKFDILETINNVGNDEVFTPVTTCKRMLDILPDEVWHNPNYKWLNPCDKNGVFLREIAIRLNEGLKDVIPDEETRKKHILKDMLYSIGLTKFTALVSRRTVYYCSTANRQNDNLVDKDGHSYNGFAIGNGSWFDSEEGNILSPITEHTFLKGKCIHCGTSEKQNGKYGRYADPTQNEHYAYEFMHVNHLNMQRHLQDRFFKGDRAMKFDIIIGNPPYQLNDGGGTGSSAVSIYQYFVNMAEELKPKYLSFIIPSRWMTGGKGLDDFRDKMIHDKHITILHDYINSFDCFTNVGIEGGVCYFLRERDRESMCEIYRHDSGNDVIKSTRYLADGNDDIFIRYNELLAIKNKVAEKHKESFEKLVSPRLPYGIGSDFLKKNKSKAKDAPFENSVAVLGYDGGRIIKYVPESEITKKSKCFNKYKVFISKARGGSAIGASEKTLVLSVPEFGDLHEICTETFLEIGPFETKEEAYNCISYIKTKFFRCLVGIRKQTQNAPNDVYRYVPQVDLTKKWTDEELYKEFLDNNKEMINFIEEHVEEMK